MISLNVFIITNIIWIIFFIYYRYSFHRKLNVYLNKDEYEDDKSCQKKKKTIISQLSKEEEELASTLKIKLRNGKYATKEQAIRMYEKGKDSLKKIKNENKFNSSKQIYLSQDEVKSAKESKIMLSTGQYETDEESLVRYARNKMNKGY